LTLSGPSLAQTHVSQIELGFKLPNLLPVISFVPSRWIAR
jgi:hypothetical protein